MNEDAHPQDRLQAGLGYRFQDPERLTAALCHSSYINEQAAPTRTSNERLEFLGDAVLNLAISHLLMNRYPALAEGELSRHRSLLVNENHLAAIARVIGIGPFLLLGRGEELTGGREKSFILADAVEAIIAAIYQDGGFEAAFVFVEEQFHQRLNDIYRSRYATDYKSMLQERAQSMFHQVPRYRVIESRGPDHDKTFRVRMSLADITAEGEGKSKKLAEQDAARVGLDRLDAGH